MRLDAPRDEVTRFIAHLDMDAFYASVELLRYPELRGKPVVIGGRRRIVEALSPGAAAPALREYSGRGVITTATYEARALGVHSGMGLMKAAKLAPEALLLPADFDEYRRYSRMFKDAVRAIAPHVEDRGIDEIYIDLTELVMSAALPHPFPSPEGRGVSPHAAEGRGVSPHAAEGRGLSLPSSLGRRAGDEGKAQWLRAREVAASVQRVVRDATGLSCSIGVTPNKLLSKIASDLEKPGGLTVLTEADIPQRIWPLPARKMNGIGPKASARLESLGIHTIGELANADPLLLLEHFGKTYGAWMHEAANGRDERAVVTYSEPKSMSRETTFEDDLHPVRDREQLSRIFTDLCMRVADDLRRKGYVGRTIGLKLRYDNFKTVTRDCTLEEPTGDAGSIRRAAGECLKRVPLDRRIRLLGVRIGTLSKPGAETPRDPASLPAHSAALFE